MPERQQQFVAGEYYHVYNRGAIRQALFHRPDAYYSFLTYMTRYAEKYKVTIVAVCLMPNHFHLLIRVEEGGDVSAFMCRLCHAYSRRLNKMLDRSGTAFQGRFNAKWVEDDAYFHQLCLYILANPVKAGLVEHPLHWQFSSFAETVAKTTNPMYNVEPIINAFGSRSAFEQEVVRYCERQTTKSESLSRSLGEMGLL